MKLPKRVGLTSVQLRPDILKMISRLTAKGLSKSEVINEALRQYLIEREFQETRRRLIPYAQAQGLFTDDDIEKRLQ